jgi:hypothetical protein
MYASRKKKKKICSLKNNFFGKFYEPAKKRHYENVKKVSRENADASE